MTTVPQSPQFSTAARDLAEAGFAPIRVGKREKKPIDSGWQTAPPDAEAVDRWIDEGGNVGLRMGEQPSGVNLVAIDEDEPGSIERKEAELGPLPPTLTAQTGGGGQHRIYAWPEGRALPRNSVKALPGIDVRSTGGQIVVEPSIHPNGSPYTWEPEHQTIETLPDAWCDALTAKRSKEPRASAAPTGAAPATDDPIVALVAPTYDQGGRHDLTRALGSHLAHLGWDDSRIEAIIRALPTDQTEKRVRDALEAAAQRRRGGVTIGWACLVERLGEPVGNAINALARDPRMPDGFTGVWSEWEARARAPGGLWDRLRKHPKRGASDSDDDPGSGVHERDDYWPVMSVTDICANLDPLNYICEALDMAPGAPTVFGGYGFSAKTISAQALTLAVVTGQPIWGKFPVRKGGGRVLHIDYEQGPRTTSDRYQRLMRGKRLTHEHVDGGLVLVSMPRLYLNPLNIQETEDELERRAEGFDLVAIDSLLASAPGLEENDSRARHLLDMLTRISERVGCVWVVIHHARKTATGQGSDPRQALRGSSAIFDACGSVLLFESADPMAPKSVTHTKARTTGRPAEPFALTIHDTSGPDGKGVTVTATSADAVKQDAARASVNADCDAVLTLVRARPEGYRGTFKAMALELKKRGTPLAQRSVQATLELLVSDGRLVMVRDSLTSTPTYSVPR